MVITNNGITTPAGSCITNVNGPGNANTNPDEYLFDIDYRIVPGGSLKSGIYELRVRFLLTEVF
jgi:acetylornithine deacetylase/succinyl-diaminopimelate desuccinylase-like protein